MQSGGIPYGPSHRSWSDNSVRLGFTTSTWFRHWSTSPPGHRDGTQSPVCFFWGELRRWFLIHPPIWVRARPFALRSNTRSQSSLLTLCHLLAIGCKVLG